ncbi:MAG: hypothetical protein WKF91_01055 [Segetibacter sp.]
MNAALKDLALNRNVNYIDVYESLIDDEKKLKKEYTFDGVHLTSQGYYKWAEVLKKGKYIN